MTAAPAITAAAPVSDLLAQALATPPTVAASYWLARMCIAEGIPGDFVECGVFCGAQCAAMARAIMDAGDPTRKVHMFDSFQGIPRAGVHDNDIRPLVGAARFWPEPSGVSEQNIERVHEHMRRWAIPPELLVYHPGWFHDTVPTVDIGAIALLRLDGDLYESTKVCMEHLYPKLSVGGWCITDDWGLDGARKAVEEIVKVRHAYWQKQPDDERRLRGVNGCH